MCNIIGLARFVHGGSHLCSYRSCPIPPAQTRGGTPRCAGAEAGPAVRASRPPVASRSIVCLCLCLCLCLCACGLFDLGCCVFDCVVRLWMILCVLFDCGYCACVCVARLFDLGSTSTSRYEFGAASEKRCFLAWRCVSASRLCLM